MSHTLPPLKHTRPVGARLTGLLLGSACAASLFAAILVVNVLQMLSLVVRPFSPRTFRSINRWLANSWWGASNFWTENIAGIEPVFTGDSLPPKENIILLANHQSMADIVAIFPLAQRKGRLGDMKWFVKDVLKYMPGIGWGMLFLDCLYVKRDWSSDREHIQNTFSNLKKNRVPFWLISFVEGTRLTARKLAASQKYARKFGLRVPANVLIPRTKGFVASVMGLRSELNAVYDLTIGYEGGTPTLWQFICGHTKRIHLHVRRYQIAELPSQDAELAGWLMRRYEEKDELLARFNASNSF